MARKHGIVTGPLFRWRSQFDFAQKKRARLAPVELPNGVAVVHLLQNLMQAPDGMTAIELSDGRRVFTPIGSDPEVVLMHVDAVQGRAMMVVPVGVKVHLALGYADMRKRMDGLAMLVQEVLEKDPFSGPLSPCEERRLRC